MLFLLYCSFIAWKTGHPKPTGTALLDRIPFLSFEKGALCNRRRVMYKGRGVNLGEKTYDAINVDCTRNGKIYLYNAIWDSAYIAQFVNCSKSNTLVPLHRVRFSLLAIFFLFYFQTRFCPMESAVNWQVGCPVTNLIIFYFILFASNTLNLSYN